MADQPSSSDLPGLLNAAIARELQVSIQYMFQHALGAGGAPSAPGKTPSARRNKFVASHAPYWLPGPTLKKIAITEMRHAEAIAERLVAVGGEPTTQPHPIIIGSTTIEMLENDREEERGAIDLYGRIIALATKEQDDVTARLFHGILADEERHLRVFSDLLAAR